MIVVRSVFCSLSKVTLLILFVFGFAILILNYSTYVTADTNSDIINNNLVTNKKTILVERVLENKHNQNFNEYHKNIYSKTKDGLINPISYYENPFASTIIFSSNMEPYAYIYEEDRGNIDSRGYGYFNLDLLMEKLYFQIYLDGMSYVEGDDVEIIQIRLGDQYEHGFPILSMCNEIKGNGHCREGPGLSVEGYLEKKDLIGPLKNYSFDDLFYILETGQAYVYVQSDDYPEGEIRGQIFRYNQ